jgi:hypothetical protein
MESDEPIRQLYLGDELITDEALLTQIEKAYAMYTRSYMHRIGEKPLTFKGGVVRDALKNEPVLKDYDYYTLQTIVPPDKLRKIPDQYPEYMLGVLNEITSIGAQVSQLIGKQNTFVEGYRKNRDDLFQSKMQVAREYRISDDNEAFAVGFRNAPNIKHMEFDLTPFLNINGNKYNLVDVVFLTSPQEIVQAVSHKGHWVLRLKKPTDDDPNKKIHKKIPDDDLSKVCGIPMR